jgi:chromosome segregation ATPase
VGEFMPMTKEELDTIDGRWDRLTTVTERTALNVEAISAGVKTLTEEVTSLSEEVKTLTHQIGILTTGLTEIKLTAERQEHNITRLVGIVERLLERA